MCGILGQVSTNADQKQFFDTLCVIKYRGPDHSDVYREGDVLLGHNRLSILDLDPRSNQPFHSADGSLTMVFNGEIYNYLEIKKELVALGHKFTTTSDTEVLIYSYREWGTACFHRFHGMFAFCIFDRKEQKLVLARDRFGEKPLFYTERKGFAFSSELKSIRELSDLKAIDDTALIDYLHFGFVPAPKTIYKNAFKLRPGYFLEYSLREKRISVNKPFYKLDLSQRSKISFEEKIEQFNKIGLQVASEISVSDVSLGAFLSGGVDSSGSVAFLKRNNSNIKTFTAGFESEDFDESSYASLVAKHLNVSNSNTKVSYGDFLESYDRMIDMYGEPHNDYSFVPTYLICKEAAKHHTVMISGDGSDEIFCGYPRYHKLRTFESLQKFGPLTRLAGTASRLLPASSNIRRQALLLEQSGDDFFFYIMSLNFSPDLAPLVYGPDLQKLAREYSSKNIVKSYLDEIPGETSFIQRQRYLDIKMTLGDDMLVKVDRASMANSIEVRPFYLHPLLTDFAFSLEPDELVTSKTDKYFLKKALEPVLPESILYRKKMGFTFPLKDLILTTLRPFFDECIAELPEHIINKKGVERLLELQKKGDRNFTAQLHSLMYLGLWLKKNKVLA